MEIQLAIPGEASENDLADIASLMRAAFGSEEDWMPKLQWQYFENPCGKAVYVNAYDNERNMVGHYAVIPVPRLADSRFSNVKTYLSLNTAVHPSAQGKGLFKKTAKAVYDHLTALGPHIVLGVANENSVHGFVNSLGFHLMGQLKVEAYLPGASPSPQAPRLLAPSPEVTSWRFSRPDGGYKRSSKGQVFCTRRFKGLPVHCFLTSGDLELQPGATLDRSRLSRWFCPAIYATYGPTNRFAWVVPEALRPSPFHLICKPTLEDTELPLLNHIQNARFELFDFDVI